MKEAIDEAYYRAHDEAVGLRFGFLRRMILRDRLKKQKKDIAKMSDDPKYEIWGLDNTPSDIDGGEGRFREDCFTFAEAQIAMREWQTNGRAAWIVDKETGKQI